MGKRKLRVCFVAPVSPPYGGIANWTNMLQEYMDEEYSDKIDYRIINTSPGKRVTEGRSTIERVGGGGFGMLYVREQLKSLIKKRVDCVHITTSGSLSVVRDLLIAKMLAEKGIPFVYHIHFGRIPELIQKNNYEWKLLQFVIKLSKTTITIDKKTFDSLSSRSMEKIVYIPNPICSQKMPKPKEAVSKTIMFLGWVIREKGIEELLAAWQILSDKYPTWKLEIVGPYKEAYKQNLLKRFRCERVSFQGEKPHDEAMELLNDAKVLCLPSYSEGCPYVIMEALMLGKIVVASDAGNIPEMVNGNSGIVVPSRNTKRLESALEKVMNHSEEYDTKKIAEAAYEQYDIREIVGQYVKEWIHLPLSHTERQT